jgi:hypothetical protein
LFIYKEVGKLFQLKSYFFYRSEVVFYSSSCIYYTIVGKAEYGLAFFKYSDGARYLCNNAQSTFSFANNRIIDAGRTVKYYLRPVKKVRFKLK